MKDSIFLIPVCPEEYELPYKIRDYQIDQSLRRRRVDISMKSLNLRASQVKAQPVFDNSPLHIIKIQ
jgi:hypothetical protein